MFRSFSRLKSDCRKFMAGIAQKKKGGISAALVLF
jgi:hypothetical protein